MRIFSRYWLIILLLIPTFSNGQDLTLTDAIKYALKNNVNIKTADKDVEIAESQIEQIVATGLPQINGSADLSYNYQVPTSFIPAVLFDPTAEEGEFLPVQFGTEYNGQAVLSASQMVFRGSYFVGLKAAKTYRELTSVSKQRTEIDVVENVTKAYYGALIAQEQMQFLKENYARLDSLYKETGIMYKNGFVEKIDVSRIKVQLNNIQADLENSDEILSLSYNLLKFQMGMPLSENITLAESMENIKVPVSEDYPKEVDLENHIAIRELNNSAQFATWDMKNIQSQYLPQVDLYGTLGANVGTNSFENYFNFNDNWFGLGTVGVRMSLPIFDGMYKSKVIQQKRLEVEKIELAKEMTEQSLDLSNKNSRIQFNKNLDKVTFQQENVELAEEIYNTAKIKYEEGIGSNLELIDADTSLKQAKTNYYSALYDLLLAKIELEKTLGLLNVTEYK